MRRRFAAFAALAVVVVALGACRDGGDGDDGSSGFTTAELEAGLIAREQFTPETASCISGYLSEGFPEEQLRELASEAPQDLPPQVWGRYTQVVLACRYHEALGVPTPAPEASP